MPWESAWRNRDGGKSHYRMPWLCLKTGAGALVGVLHRDVGWWVMRSSCSWRWESDVYFVPNVSNRSTTVP